MLSSFDCHGQVTRALATPGRAGSLPCRSRFLPSTHPDRGGSEYWPYDILSNAPVTPLLGHTQCSQPSSFPLFSFGAGLQVPHCDDSFSAWSSSPPHRLYRDAGRRRSRSFAPKDANRRFHASIERHRCFSNAVRPICKGSVITGYGRPRSLKRPRRCPTEPGSSGRGFASH